MQYDVRIFSKSADGKKYLSKNFQVEEFACADGSDPVIINMKLIPYCQQVRDRFGKAWKPNSAYRTVEHNKKVKGEFNSQHLYGNAVDIPAAKLCVTPKVLYDYCNTMIGNNGGVGMYDWGVHIDVRGYKARWDYRTKK